MTAGRGEVTLRGSALSVRIGERTVLDGVDVAARAGAILAVTGPAGSGKTTLLHVLAGIIAPSAGAVSRETDAGAPRGGSGRVGFVPQTFGLAAALTAAENVAVPLQLLRLPREKVAARVQGTLAALGLEGAAGQLPAELSGGQQQRTAVARAIVSEPPLIIADEPTSELDAASRDVVFDLLRSAAVGGATVVLATHDSELTERCDEVLSLHDGRVVG